MNNKRTLLLVVFSTTLGFVLLLIIRQIIPNALLFESILISSIASVVITSISYSIKWGGFSSNMFLSILLSFLLIITPSFLVLMNIDRSRSFYVLVWATFPRSAQEIENQSIIAFGSAEKFGILMRLKEQEKRGLIKHDEGFYSLTTTGRLMVTTADMFASLYKLDNYNHVRATSRP